MSLNPIVVGGYLIWREVRKRRIDGVVTPFRVEMEAVRHGEGMGAERFTALRKAVLDAYPAVGGASPVPEHLGVVRDVEGLIDWMNARTRYRFEQSARLRSILPLANGVPSDAALNAVTAMQLALGEYEPEALFAKPHAIPAAGPARELFDRGVAMFEHAGGRIDPGIWERGSVANWSPPAPTSEEFSAAVMRIRQIEGAVICQDGKPEVGAAVAVSADLAGAWAVIDHAVLASNRDIVDLVMAGDGSIDTNRLAAVSKLAVALGVSPARLSEKGLRVPLTGVTGMLAAQGLGTLKLHQHDVEHSGLQASSRARPFRGATR
ncbi:MAG: hypothetical protein ACOYNI_12275 [Acidimicrobiia bacterium]